MLKDFFGSLTPGIKGKSEKVQLLVKAEGEVEIRPQRDQEFSIPGFPGRDFAKSRDHGIFRDGISLKFQSRDFRQL